MSLSVWRDQAKGIHNGRKLDGSDSDDSRSDSDGEPDAEKARDADVPVATDDERERDSSRAPSMPPTSASEAEALDDDFDIDAMIRDEELQQATSNNALRQPSAPPIPSAKPDAAAAQEEDEAMWDELMGDIPDDAINAADSQTPAPQAPISDEDEEMDWDVVREIEQETSAASAAQTPPSPVAEPSSAEPTSASDSGPLPGSEGYKATNDEGWDEMYA